MAIKAAYQRWWKRRYQLDFILSGTSVINDDTVCFSPFICITIAKNIIPLLFVSKLSVEFLLQWVNHSKFYLYSDKSEEKNMQISNYSMKAVFSWSK